jgi:hypothetical protein
LKLASWFGDQNYRSLTKAVPDTKSSFITSPPPIPICMRTAMTIAPVLALIFSAHSGVATAAAASRATKWHQPVHEDTVLQNYIDFERMTTTQIDVLVERNDVLAKENAMLKKLILGEGEWVKEVTEDEVTISLDNDPVGDQVDDEESTQALVNKVQELLASDGQTLPTDVEMVGTGTDLDLELDEDDEFEVQLDEYEITLEYEPGQDPAEKAPEQITSVSSVLRILEDSWMALSGMESGDLAHEGDEWSFEEKPADDENEFVTSTSTDTVYSSSEDAKVLAQAIRSLRGSGKKLAQQ